jgi:hypothetical protein
MPRIASGIDRLWWPDVRDMIVRSLGDTPRSDGRRWDVTVFYL